MIEQFIVPETSNKHIKNMSQLVNNIARRLAEEDIGEGEGRWITINGRHVFIKEGQSVEDAMKTSFTGGIGGTQSKRELLESSLFRGKEIEPYKERFRQSLVGIPDSHLEGTKIEVTPEHKPGVFGTYHSTDDYITLDPSATKSTIQSGIIRHEIGHRVYNVVLKERYREYDEIWRSFREGRSSEKPISSYGETNSREDFAEAYRYYLSNKQEMKSSHPQRYAFMESIFK